MNSGSGSLGSVKSLEVSDFKDVRSSLSKYRAPKSSVQRVLYKEKLGEPWFGVFWVK